MANDKRYIETGRRNDAYRAAARMAHPDVTVSTGAAVFPIADGGAFVECIVFVSEAAATTIEEEDRNG